MGVWKSLRRLPFFFLYQEAWDDIRFPFIGRNLDTSSGRIDYNYTELGVDFADNARYNATEQISIICQMHHDYKLESPVHPHIHWVQSQAAVPNWVMLYRVYRNGDDPTGAFTPVKIMTHNIPYVSGSILQISSFPAIDMTGIDTVSAFIDIKLYRDTNNDSGLFTGTDPVSGDVLSKEFDIHYIKDAFGSRTELLK